MHTTSNVNRAAQAAAHAALTSPDMLAVIRPRLMSTRDRMLELLKPLGLDRPVPQGAFYHFPDLSRYGRDDVALAAELLERAQVATVPGSAFGAPGHLRLSYSGSASEVDRGVRRLARYLARRPLRR